MDPERLCKVNCVLYSMKWVQVKATHKKWLLNIRRTKNQLIDVEDIFSLEQT